MPCSPIVRARMLRTARLVMLAATLAPVAACGLVTARAQVRGNKVDMEELGELVPGVSTRADATSLLGSPTMHATFDDNTWLYVGSITRPVIAGTQHIVVQQTVALNFDQNGVLRDITTRDKKDALGSVMIARVTPSPGSNASFMQQLLGNVGRFNAGGSQQGGQGGTPGNGSGDVGGDSSRFSTGSQQ